MSTRRAPRSRPTVTLLRLPCLAALGLAASAAAQAPFSEERVARPEPAPRESREELLHVLNRVTYGPSAESWREIRALGAAEFIRRQLDPLGLDDSLLEARLAAALPDPAVAPDALADPEEEWYGWPHLRAEHLIRARHSRRQLLEILTEFWSDHFNTLTLRGGPARQQWWQAMAERDELEAFRRHAFGRFRDLLEVSAKSPAMLDYLHASGNTFQQGNEDYARELLELHSLGVDCGYSQADVEEAARVFTGWMNADHAAAHPRQGVVIEDRFAFVPAAHDPGAKLVLGLAMPAGGGLEEGEQLLDLLAEHPCTARHLSTKLLRKFVCDEPAPELVERISAVFLASGGDVAQVLRAVFRSPEFRAVENRSAKTRDPMEWSLAAMRGAEVGLGVGDGSEQHLELLHRQVSKQGMVIFGQELPTGWPERASAWVSAAGLAERWRTADHVLHLGGPFEGGPGESVAALGLRDAAQVVRELERRLLPEPLSDTEREGLVELLGDAAGRYAADDPEQEARLREVLALLLGHPSFQRQ